MSPAAWTCCATTWRVLPPGSRCRTSSTRRTGSRGAVSGSVTTSQPRPQPQQLVQPQERFHFREGGHGVCSQGVHSAVLEEGAGEVLDGAGGDEESLDGAD